MTLLADTHSQSDKDFTALKIRGVSKAFSNVSALKEVSLELNQGEMLAVLGPSGCGKTTLLRSIAGFESPEEGQIIINGKTVFDSEKRINIRPEKRHIGYVPQEGVLFPHITAAENIGFGLAKGSQRQKRIDEMLELVGMKGLGERMPHELSGGQQQRIALARALAPSPSLVLLDEPFSALDAGLRAEIREDVRTSLREVGATAIIVTHDQEEALSMADIVAVMREGRAVQVADPVTLYRYPADIYVAEFVGEATLLHGEVCNGHVKSFFGEIPVAGACPDCQKAVVMVRPEQFKIDKIGVDIPTETSCVSGRVTKFIFYGHDALIHLKLDEPYGGHGIQVRVSGTRRFKEGEHVALQIDGEVMAYATTPTNTSLKEIPLATAL